jgi:ribosomal protein L17
MIESNRREFITGAACAAAASMTHSLSASEEETLDVWQRETDLVLPDTYRQYLKDGNTRGFAALEKLEKGFERIVEEIRTVKIRETPAVWNVYNMGYIIKTQETLFSIDLVHRRAEELAEILDFSLVTHNHGDHFHAGLYNLMNKAGKTVISNFLDNYGAHFKKNIGGYTREKKTFNLKDVEIRTSLIDHNGYLIDFTTAFEIKYNSFIIYHTGDSGWGTEKKLSTTFGKADLWLFFPGCGINPGKAVEIVKPKRISIGHIWELDHKHNSRLTSKMVRGAIAEARKNCPDVSAGYWGERIV